MNYWYNNSFLSLSSPKRATAETAPWLHNWAEHRLCAVRAIGVNPLVSTVCEHTQFFGYVVFTYKWTLPEFLTTWSLITWDCVLLLSKWNIIILIAKYYVQLCKKLQLLGTCSPKPPTGAWLLDHTRGLPIPSSFSSIKWQWVPLLQSTVYGCVLVMTTAARQTQGAGTRIHAWLDDTDKKIWSRFAFTEYNARNLVSWFSAKLLKLLPSDVRF